MRYAFQFKVNFTGGIISPGYLLHIMQVLQDAGIEEVRFGLRQQLLIDVTKNIWILDENTRYHECSLTCH